MSLEFLEAQRGEFLEAQRGARDPLLAALIGKLPAAGAAWPREDRGAWLNLMGAAFDIVYGRDETPGLLAALIGKLPAAGAAWPREDREAWLNLMRAAFDIVYGRDETPGLLRAGAATAKTAAPPIRVDDDESAVAA